MLYYPNNVAVEASPVTKRLELEVARPLAVMIGYPERSWGHIASGGTVANFEAVWVARNIIYLPIAATGAADQLGVDLNVRTARGDLRALRDVELTELVNNDTTLDL